MWNLNLVSLFLTTLTILVFSGICFTNVCGDLIKPSRSMFTDNPAASVLLRATPKQLNEHPPITVPTLLRQAADNYRSKIALLLPNKEVVTYLNYQTTVRTVAKAFIKLGLPRYYSVGILGYNAPEWFYTYLGAIVAGGIASAIDMTSSPEACQYSLNLSRAYIVVVENDEQLQKILKIKSNLPHLRTIIQYTGTPSDRTVLSWQKIMEIGESESDEKLESILPTIAVNECCSIVYTSVATGNPKAVMLSHDNLTYEANKLNDVLTYTSEEEPTTVSHIPLDNVTAQIVDIYLPLTNGGKVAFAEQGENPFLFYWIKYKPTTILGVPKTWAFIHDKVTETVRKMSSLPRTAFKLAQNGIAQYHETITFKRKPSDPPIDPKNLDSSEQKAIATFATYQLLAKKLKENFGLSKSKYVIASSGPILAEVKKFYLTLDEYLLEAYDNPESSGPQTIIRKEFFRLTGLGITLPGMETKIIDDKMKIENCSEVYLRGRNVFMGYMSMGDQNNEVFDNDGWFHTGDMGRIDEDTNLQILGKVKDFIVLEGGQFIPPIPIEDAVLNQLSFVNKVALVGNNRKYLSILLTIVISNDNGSTLELKDISWCQKIISNCTKISDIFDAPERKRQKIYKVIQDGITAVNNEWMKKNPAYEIKKFEILIKDFPPKVLKPNSKVSHAAVDKKYPAIIHKLYNGQN